MTMAAGHFPKTMRRLVVRELGTNFSQVTEITEAPVPEPGPDYLLVRNKYLGINAADVRYSNGYDWHHDPSDHEVPFEIGLEVMHRSVSVRGFLLADHTNKQDLREFAMRLMMMHFEGLLVSTVDMGEKSPHGPFRGLHSVGAAVEHLHSSKNIGKVVVQLY